MLVYIICDENNRVTDVATTPIGENPIGVEVEDKDIFTNPFNFLYENGDLIKENSQELTNRKIEKMAAIEALCDASIIAGFDYEINGISYHFSSSLAAQANFQGTDTLFKDGLISDVEWTVTNNATGAVERISFDQTVFNQLKLQVFIHINSNISKLRNELQPKVDAAQSQTELDLIIW
ncbi:DUF4376 domain-containing protein [Neobacillus sp. M.A.Huq-85]